MAAFSVEVGSVPGVTVLRVSGEIDIATVDYLRTAFHGLVADAGCLVVVDLERVTFIDATGIAALVVARRQFGDGDRLRVVATHPQVVRVLRIVGVTGLLGLRPSVHEAVNDLVTGRPASAPPMAGGTGLLPEPASYAPRVVTYHVIGARRSPRRTRTPARRLPGTG